MVGASFFLCSFNFEILEFFFDQDLPFVAQMPRDAIQKKKTFFTAHCGVILEK